MLRIFLIGISITAITLMLLSLLAAKPTFWAAFVCNGRKGKVLLYQKQRMMHQAPEILVYYQDNEGANDFVGTINLPEDNRSHIAYEFKQLDPYRILLQLSCEPCMIELRTYIIDLKKTTLLVDYHTKFSKSTFPSWY